MLLLLTHTVPCPIFLSLFSAGGFRGRTADRSKRILFLYDTRSRRRFYFLVRTHAHTHTLPKSKSERDPRVHRVRHVQELCCYGRLVLSVVLACCCCSFILPFSLTLVAQSCVIYCAIPVSITSQRYESSAVGAVSSFLFLSLLAPSSGPLPHLISFFLFY